MSHTPHLLSKALFPQTRIKKTPRERLIAWLHQGLDLLFPPRCVACSRLGEWLCTSCLNTVEYVPSPICPKCGRPTTSDALCYACRQNETPLDGIRSVAIHDGALRQAIHHLKYRHRRELAPILGRLLFEYLDSADIPVDIVVPVPLHISRQKERGFNQAELLARTLATHSGVPIDATHLIRIRPTMPQVGLGAQERKNNVNDAFSWNGPSMADTAVLLVDDVCTTGATLEASASALRRAGATTIWALTLTRAR